MPVTQNKPHEPLITKNNNSSHVRKMRSGIQMPEVEFVTCYSQAMNQHHQTAAGQDESPPHPQHVLFFRQKHKSAVRAGLEETRRSDGVKRQAKDESRQSEMWS